MQGPRSFPLGRIQDLAAQEDCPLCRLVIKCLDKELAENAPETVYHLNWDDMYGDDISRHSKGGSRCLYISYGSPLPWGPRFFLLAADAPSELCLGRVVHQEINIQLLRRWMSMCDEWHGAECQEPVFHKVDNPWSLPSFFLIDAHMQCLVRPSTPSRYLALSYVWGTTKSLLTIQSNLHDLQKPLAFTRNSNLSNTVRDAIKLTEMLGERFLWIDQLCIVQDDITTKQIAIKNMDKIYAHAELTIVAAAGNNATVGLPGVNGRPRTPQIMEEVKEGLRLIFASRWPEELDHSYYETRAWT